VGMYGDSGLIVPHADDPLNLLGYLREACQEGDNFLRSQRGYLQIDLAQRMIMGDFGADDIRSADLSHVTDNEFGSIALQLQAQNTDTRPFFIYTTKNPSYSAQARMLNVCAEHWWLARQVDMRFRDAINGCSAGGTSCLWTTWNPFIGDYETRYIDGRDALPVRPSSYHSYQDCEALVIRQERSTNELKRRWPSMADSIRADRDGTAGMGEEAETYSQRVLSTLNKSPFTLYREFLSKAKAAMSSGAFPVTDLFTAYIHDYSRNESDHTKLMGPWTYDARPRPLRNWSYEVPPGEPLYPGGRVVVCTNTAILYDGPNSYWHDQFPASKLTMIQWPFEKCYLGKAPLWDIIEWQKELNESQRRIADHCAKFVDPDLVIDQNSGLSRSSAEKIRARKAGGKFFKRPGPGDGFRFEYPPPMPAEVLMRPDAIISRMRSLAQTFDMQTVLNKGQLPANEALTMMMSLQTAGVRTTSRTLEAFMREFGYQRAYDFAQNYTKAMRLTLMGPMGSTPQDFDIDPSVLVPAFVGEDYDSKGQIKQDRLQQPRTRRSRAKDYLRNFSFDVRPNSMLKAAHENDELKYLQLARGGFIDPVTMLEFMEFPNIGQDQIPGGDPGTVVGRLLKLSQANLLGSVGPAGRRSSGQQAPQLKSSGAISESG
jgi:hypothetical protein